MSAIRRSARWMGVTALDVLVMGFGLAVGVAIVALLISST
jgi:hypothetical protein